MRYLFVLALAGCAGDIYDVYNTCVQQTAYVGYRIKNDDGKIGTVTKIYGASDRCKVESHPVLAAVLYE
jgi:hypothetical protein